jgi:hypothetical protein
MASTDDPRVETLVILQPNYIPWLGTFDLIDRADLCVWYDDVQYTKNDWRNRNRIAAGEGVRWLTIPVLTRGHFGQAIKDVAIDPRHDWAKKHLRSFEQEYARAPFFETARELYAGVLARGHQLLADVTIELFEVIARRLGTRTRFVRSSTLEGIEGEKQARVLAVCGRFGARVYLSGPAGKGYLDPREFAERGIGLRYIVYDYERYDRGRAPREENLSILDTLAWLGPEATAARMRHNRRVEEA